MTAADRKNCSVENAVQTSLDNKKEKPLPRFPLLFLIISG